MDNARSSLQIPVLHQISVKDDTSDFCNNTVATEPRAQKIQAARLQEHCGQAKRYKSGIATRTAWCLIPVPLLSRHLVVGGKTCMCKCRL